MYNRYVPQSDGSYQRSRIPEPPRPAPPPHPVPSPPPKPNPKPAAATPPPSPPPDPPKKMPKEPPKEQPPIAQKPAAAPALCCPKSASSFFKGLLPKNLEMEDLFILILLLLMAGDEGEDGSNLLMTLAIYLLL